MSNMVKVGIFVTVCLAVLAYLILKVEDLRLFGPEGRRVDAVFDSVVGLDDQAPVRVAGVRVGRVDGVRLDGRQARVTLLLEQPVALTTGSEARIANAGILGDKYVSLVPGPATAAPLAEGETIPGVTPITFDEALARFDDIGKSIQSLTGELSGRDLGATVARLVENLEATSADIRALVAANREEVTATVAHFERFSASLAEELPKVSGQLRQILAQVDTVVAENRENLAGSLDNVRQVTDRLKTSVDNLNAISGQVASGEGSLGKLVYSDQAHDELVSTLEAIDEGVGTLTDTFGRIKKLDLELGLEGSYFTELEESRTGVQLEVAPRPDRFYYVELVDDPRGKLDTRTDTITTTFPDGHSESTRIERTTVRDDFTISAQFGFRFPRFDLRAGLFESTGGAALDYPLLDRRLLFSLEAFDFSRQNDLDPRLRFTTRWRVHPHLYLLGGVDDLLVNDNESLFFGAGVRWKDEDLKYLLGSLPRF